jgi:6-pyruvoyltetrahydropterin/6-carboxytetrahydropterin synthase
MSKIFAQRYHDASIGHRVCGHETVCRHLHGHNYRFHFNVEAQELDSIGRVVDFSVIKSTLCQWLEDWWDHKFLLWEQDPMLELLLDATRSAIASKVRHDLRDSIVTVPFNPTAENMGKYLVDVIGPNILPKGLVLRSVKIEETRKCSAEIWSD